MFVAFVAPRTTDPRSATTAVSKLKEPAATVDKSATMQADRQTFIQKAIKNGAFTKIEVPGSLPRVWVTPAFMDLDFDTKTKFISVVYAYYFDGSNETDTVRLFDSRSGKEVGGYSMVYGGLKMF